MNETTFRNTEARETLERARARETNAKPEAPDPIALYRAAVNGPTINRQKLGARVHDGIHYRDGRARVSFDAPQFSSGDEIREFAAWLETVAAVADLRSLGGSSPCS